MIVIKFGGEIVESPQDLKNLTNSVKALREQGRKVVLLHGGGPFATKLSQRLGIETKMVGGRRITCSDTLDVMKMSLPGVINTQIMCCLKRTGVKAATVSGISVATAVKRPPRVVSGGGDEPIDFGLVGDVKEVDTELIHLLLNGGFVPVISPLTSDGNGQALNINADTVCAEITRKLQASDLILVTKVGGVFADLNNPDSRMQNLSVVEAKEKIKSGIIQGGMIPKLEESFPLLQEGLKVFHIVGTATPTSILEEIENPGSIGTAVSL